MKRTMITKNSILFFLAFCFAINCAAQRSRSQTKVPFEKKYPEKYKDQLEPGSELLAALYHITVEKTVDGKFIKKQYYPSTKQITSYETFADENLKIKDGVMKSWSDEGILSSEKYFEKGKYIKTNNSINGKKTRPYKKLTPAQRDSLKQANKDRKPLLKSRSDKKIYKAVQDMPTFPGCEEEEDKNKRKACAEKKMLEFIYGNIKYPSIAREEGIQGRVLATFVISKTGEIKDIKIPRGLCNEIKLESIRVIESMPKWNPGKQRGEAVDVQFTLPITYRLSGIPSNSKKSQYRKRKRSRRN